MSQGSCVETWHGFCHVALKLLVTLCVSPLHLKKKGESYAFSIFDSLSFDIEVNIDDLISACDMKD